MQKQTQKKSWVIGVIILSLGWFLVYATRTALSSALKDIGDFWSLSEGFLGILSSSFFVSYALLQVPTGILADKFGARKMIVIGFAVQAVGLLLGVLSRSPYQFLFARVLTGAGQASYFACQQAIIFFMLPPKRRARGVAMTTAGAGMGSAAGFVLGKFLSSSTLGWKMPFVVLTFLAGVYIAIVIKGVPEPPFGREKVSKRMGEKNVIADKYTTRLRWEYLGFMAICHFLTMYSFNLMLSWLPYYLEAVRGFESSLSAIIPVVMPLIMAPSAVIWGAAADKRKSRDFVLWICLPIAGLAIITIPAMATPFLVALSLVFYGMTGKLVFDPVLTTAVSENAPPNAHGSFLATFNLAASLSMVIAPSATGFIAQKFGSFDVSFFMAGAFHFAALFAFIQAKRSLQKLHSFNFDSAKTTYQHNEAVS